MSNATQSAQCVYCSGEITRSNSVLTVIGYSGIHSENRMCQRCAACHPVLPERLTADHRDSIYRRLRGATPFPWAANEELANAKLRRNSRQRFALLLQGPDQYRNGRPEIDTLHRSVVRLRYADLKDSAYIGLPNWDDWNLIANAPLDLLVLLREVAALKRQNAELRAQLEGVESRSFSPFVDEGTG